MPITSRIDEGSRSLVVQLHDATANEELEEQSKALKESQAHLESQQAELERLGLARGRQVHADLGRSLRLIANASAEYYAFFNQGDDETRTALVVQSGDDALRVVLRADKHFVLEPVRVEDVVQSLVSALPEAPDVAVLDIRMPTLTGVELTRREFEVLQLLADATGRVRRQASGTTTRFSARHTTAAWRVASRPTCAPTARWWPGPSRCCSSWSVSWAPGW
mgnify:CR=1 FL=1